MGEKAPEISSLSFEEALKELEALSQRLSQGGLPLEESVEAYARGSELRKHCNDLLKRAEDRVRELDQKFGNQQDDDKGGKHHAERGDQRAGRARLRSADKGCHVHRNRPRRGFGYGDKAHEFALGHPAV